MIYHKVRKEKLRRMGCLGSYSFGSYMGVDEIPEKVLGLFADPVRQGKSLNYASEIVFSGIRGRIDLNREFNIEAYEKAIEKNGQLSAYNKKKKESYLDFGSSDDYDSVTQSGGVQAERLNLEVVQDAFEELLDNDELACAVSNIRRLNDEFITVEETDIIEAIRLALKGIPQAIKELKRICEFYPQISENIKTILSCGLSFDEVFA